MAEVWQKVDSILEQADIPERHTFFQLKNFIIGKEYTLQGQLWQIVRELRARRESLISMDRQIDEAEDELKLLDIRVGRLEQRKCVDEFDQLEKEILIRQSGRNRKSLTESIDKVKAKIKYLVEEVEFLVGAFETLSKAQPMKSLDDISAQKEYWNEKLGEELNLRLLLKNHLDTDFVRTIVALEDDVPVKNQMMGILHKVQEQLLQDRNAQKASQARIK